jgi:hypothetical protein
MSSGADPDALHRPRRGASDSSAKLFHTRVGLPGREDAGDQPNSCWKLCTPGTLRKMHSEASQTSMTGVEIPITRLFSDIRGSTAVAEGMRRADFHRFLNRFYRHRIRTVYWALLRRNQPAAPPSSSGSSSNRPGPSGQHWPARH